MEAQQQQQQAGSVASLLRAKEGVAQPHRAAGHLPPVAVQPQLPAQARLSNRPAHLRAVLQRAHPMARLELCLRLPGLHAGLWSWWPRLRVHPSLPSLQASHLLRARMTARSRRTRCWRQLPNPVMQPQPQLLLLLLLLLLLRLRLCQ